jgi:hypothetical protein
MEISSKTGSYRYPLEDEQFWQTHLSDFSVSGMKRSAYCKKHNISYPRFNYQIRSLKKSKKNTFASSSKLVPIKLKSKCTEARQDDSVVLCTVTLNNGCVLRVHHERDCHSKCVNGHNPVSLF